MSVGILVVSHSAKIADGVLDLARQMAPDVRFAVAGGTEDGGIGTSFDTVTAGISELADTEGIVVLCDLGSAYLTVDTALDFLEDADRDRIIVSRAPLVEGAIAAAVAAQTGGSVDNVAMAADSAGGSVPDALRSGGSAPVHETPPDDAVVATVVLVNETGLHARPAAEFVKTAAKHDAAVTVNGVDAKSLLAIMALALPKGATLRIVGRGPDADDVVAALVSLVEGGFGE